MTAPEAVLLDAGGVLVLPNQWAIVSVLRAAGGSIDPSSVRRAHYAGTAAMDAARDRNWERYYRVLLRFAEVPEARMADATAGLRAAYTAPAFTLWNVVPEGVVEQLRDLAATGVAIAVVSNSDGTVESTLRRCEIPFDIVIDSGVVGIEKPSPEIFHIALQKLDVEPSRAVHVGDTAWADVDGAHAAGVRPVHMDPFGDCRDPAGHHEHARCLADVVALVRSERRADGVEFR